MQAGPEIIGKLRQQAQQSLLRLSYCARGLALRSPISHAGLFFYDQGKPSSGSWSACDSNAESGCNGHWRAKTRQRDPLSKGKKNR